MRFPKVLEKLLKNPKTTFSSKSCNTYEQNLETIRYWLCEENEPPTIRSKAFNQFLNATDWKEDINARKTKRRRKV